jgi:D-aminopeptidase
MICHGFKGGIGTASRRLAESHSGWTVGALVQANYGVRDLLRIDGVPVGREIPAEEVPVGGFEHGLGSIIVVLATDAPLIPTQCRRLAQRATLALGRMGSAGADSSGDIFIAFSTGNRPAEMMAKRVEPVEARLLSGAAMSALFAAAVEAVEEAIVNALCMAETMTGQAGRTVYALPLDRLVGLMAAHGRL